MEDNMMYKRSIFTMLFVVLLYAGSLFAQPKPSCAFFSKKGWDSNDSLLVEKLKEKYDISILNARGFDDGSLKIDSLNQFDFAFISESITTCLL